MVSELLRHSNRADVCERIPEHLRLCHRPREVTRDDAPVMAHSKARKQQQQQPIRPVMTDLFGADNEWALGPLGPVTLREDEEEAEPDAPDDDDDLLELEGF